MGIRPVGLQAPIQNSSTAAHEQAARTQAPLAAQAQSEQAEPARTARLQSSVNRSLKEEAPAVGDDDTSNETPKDRTKEKLRRQRKVRTEAPPIAGKGQVLDVRF